MSNAKGSEASVKKNKQSKGDRDGDWGGWIQFSIASLGKGLKKRDMGDGEVVREWTIQLYLGEEWLDRGTVNAKPPRQGALGLFHTQQVTWCSCSGDGGERGTEWMTKAPGGPEGGQKDYIKVFRSQEVFEHFLSMESCLMILKRGMPLWKDHCGRSRRVHDTFSNRPTGFVYGLSMTVLKSWRWT